MFTMPEVALVRNCIWTGYPFPGALTSRALAARPPQRWSGCGGAASGTFKGTGKVSRFGTRGTSDVRP